MEYQGLWLKRVNIIWITNRAYHIATNCLILTSPTYELDFLTQYIKKYSFLWLSTLKTLLFGLNFYNKHQTSVAYVLSNSCTLWTVSVNEISACEHCKWPAQHPDPSGPLGSPRLRPSRSRHGTVVTHHSLGASAHHLLHPHRQVYRPQQAPHWIALCFNKSSL